MRIVVGQLFSILILLNYIKCVKVSINKDDYKINVDELPKWPKFQLYRGNTYSGMIPTRHEYLPQRLANKTTESGQLFFWFHESIQYDESGARKKLPLTIWMNGGPGCSSMAGKFFENGPVLINTTNNTFYENEYSWTNVSHMLYIEHPVHTGFADADFDVYTRDEYEVGRDFYAGLLFWYEIFNEFQDKDLYLFGESFAGFYLPAIGKTLEEENIIIRNKISKNENSENEFVIPLKGVAVGNGWVDAVVQMQSYAEYAYSHGLIDLPTKYTLDAEWEVCKETFTTKHPPTLLNLDSVCGILTDVMSASGVENEFDIRLFHTYNSILSPDSFFFQFLNSKSVQQTLHADALIYVDDDDDDDNNRIDINQYHYPKKNWTICNTEVFNALDNSTLITMKHIFEWLLDESDIKLLFYNGNEDLTCNFLGTQTFLNELSWSGSNGWTDELRYLWRNEGVFGGYHKSYKNLHFIIAWNSGHLVPLDQPSNALNMVYRFENDISFNDEKLKRINETTMSTQPIESNTTIIINEGYSNWDLGIGAIIGFVFGALGAFIFVWFSAKTFVQQWHRYHNIPHPYFDIKGNDGENVSLNSNRTLQYGYQAVKTGPNIVVKEEYQQNNTILQDDIADEEVEI